MEIANKAFAQRRNIVEQKVTASKVIAYDSNHGLRVFLCIQCPSNGHFKIEFDVISPDDITKQTFESACSCGYLHTCNAFGRVISTYSEQ